jgi:hypothetical protein
MGEPRTPTPQDRTATRHLAARILQSIRDDEEMDEAMGLDEMEFASGRYGYYSEAVEDLVASLAQEVCALEAERERRTAAIWAVIDMFDGAVRNFETRSAGGQHVPYHGDFASMPPSAASQMRRWIRDLMEALHDRWPMNRAEFTAMFPNTPADALDHMFRERQR